MNSPIRALRTGLLLLVVALLPLLSLTIPAEDTPGFTTFAPYFKVDQGFETILVLRNRHVKTAIRVTPVLYGDGADVVRLPETEVPANAVTRLSLGPALQQEGSRIASGAVALEYSGPGTLRAMAVVRDPARSIIFGFPFRRGYVNGESQVFDSNWWLRDEETEGYLALFNSSDETITVRIEVAGNQTRFALQSVHLASKEFRKFQFRRLLREAGIHGIEMGSLTLRYEGPAHALVPGLFFSNERNGFSLTAAFAARESQPDLETATTINVPNALIHQPDSGIGFPQHVRFSAMALVSNLTDSFVPLDLVATYELDGQATQVMLPGTRLAPAETRLIDLGESGLIPRRVGSIALRVSHPGPPTAIAARFFSVDPTGNWLFTAESMPAAGRIFDAMIWDVANNSSSMISIQNAGDEEATVRVTLSYENGQGRYRLPLFSIPAGSTRTVNVNQVVAAGQPDEDGNVIPPEVTFGSARVQAEGANAGAARLAVVAAAFDPVRGMCAEYLGGCPIFIAARLIPDPIVGFVGEGIFVGGEIEYDDFQFEPFTPALFGANFAVAQTSGNFIFLAGPGSTDVESFVEVLVSPDPWDEFTPCYPSTEIAQAGVTCLVPPPPPPCTNQVTISTPPDNPNPSDATVATNFSFLAQRSFGNVPIGDTIMAQATLSPSGDTSQITWQVTPNVGSIRNPNPANLHGPSFSFVPDPPAHPMYLGGSSCASPGNGSCQRSAALSYAITAQFCISTDTNTITQDQVDIIRQEYRNHGITVPTRPEFNIPFATPHFTVGEINQTSYSFILGTPGALAEAIRSNYNTLINDDTQQQPVGTSGLLASAVVVAPGANIQTIGAILDTPACNGAPNPVTCDDSVLGNTIIAGPNGIAETQAVNQITSFGLVMTSAWRNPERNEAFSGLQDSLHQFGNAVDLAVGTVPGKTPTQLWCILQTAADLVPGANGFTENKTVQVPCTNSVVTHVHTQQ